MDERYRTRAAASRRLIVGDSYGMLKLLVSTEDRWLWLVSGRDTLMSVPVAIGCSSPSVSVSSVDAEPVAGATPATEPELDRLAHYAVRYFNDRAGSIYAGSNEIQRNILAKAALGL